MRLYIKFFLMSLRSQMQYKISFWLYTISQFLGLAVSFLSIYVMFQKFDTVQGFTYHQVIIGFSIVYISYSLTECFFRGFDLFSTIISNGEFDRMMLRPRNEIFQVLCHKIEIGKIGKFVFIVLIFAFIIPDSNIVWSLDRCLILLTMMVFGFLLFSSLFIVNGAFCFFTIEGLEFMNIFTDGARELGKYPIGVYGKGFLRFFTYIIPVACIQYYPLLYLFGETDNILYALTPFAVVLFTIPCLLFWRYGVSRYKSTGS